MNINTDYYYDNYLSELQAVSRRKQTQTSRADNKGDEAAAIDMFASLAAALGSSLETTSVGNASEGTESSSSDESGQEASNAAALERLLASGNQARQMKEMHMPPISSFIDRDNDSIWSTDELTQFTDMLNEATGSTLDAESILSKYDTDGDGSLNRAEQVQMLKDMSPPPPLPKIDSDLFEITDETAEEEAATVLATGETSEQFDKIREKVYEIYEILNEILAKKQEEAKLTENSDSNAESLKTAFLSRIAKSIDKYEKAFMFDDLPESTQYGA